MKKSQFTRRQMLHSSLIAAGATAMATTSNGALGDQPKVQLKQGDVVLFQGDSITDARRDRKSEKHANNSRGLGYGYPLLIGSKLLQDHPKLSLKVYNRGISGNKVPDLQKRWQTDCLDLKPAVLSILIGVNDMWHKMNGKYDGTVKDYQTGFTTLLQQTKAALPDTKIVICEPFVLRCGAVKESWIPEFDQRRAVAKEVAQTAGTIWVPFQSMFDEAIAAGTKPDYWAGDGVHPTLAGHALMGQTWRDVVGV
ncbi:MAG: SGNH/GDSL hydrolase family protein [Planctomycetes bacterium]|nr:SGNH/GDSL hydrolase family protein [Planctomycetota bacterium]MCH9727661.1 SGNH/GDSL hydrolase family protein [Planctomycetota bacterium]MCH9775086.1 SGNH/GDSL hydrolase family protein [Planctomycetota bacterium]MCH9789596.1 SGNH/GDSL hydrolase family protein [Planctomycetota bacterium]MDF1745396.1 SGNH/GDSL hydrolase family protein [Gimesia sp.]